MKKIAYFHAPTGLSGDMIMGALVDAGAPLNELLPLLQALPLTGWEIQAEPVLKGSLQACRMRVLCPAEEQPRYLPEIQAIIRRAAFPKRAEALALTAFQHLAEAEGKIHGCPIGELHFHEVGAMDAILDICLCALAFDALEIQEAYCAPLPLSHGFTECAHGIIPLPAPAVMALLEGAKLAPSNLPGELITPTGAALLKTFLAEEGFSPPAFTLLKTGLGAGSKDLPIPNILRLSLGLAQEEALEDEVEVLTAALDDCNPEFLGDLWQRAAEKGALDLYYAPAFMKKGRPGWEITLLAPPGRGEEFAQLLFTHTTTIGLRIRREKRLILPREIIHIPTIYGEIALKKAGNQLSPEYESCRLAAEAHQVPIKTVYQAALAAAAALPPADKPQNKGE